METKFSITEKTVSSKVEIIKQDARFLSMVVEANSIDLVVTSPPYPMISMWDEIFRKLDPSIPPSEEWKNSEANDILERMHIQLDLVWNELWKCLKNGGIVAINIGDATRSIEKNFRLFPNAARTTMGMLKVGFTPLPNIYWKKPTNGPNAFLGSGFFPVNAYVTVDCEHILLFRKGKIRKFPSKDPRRSASKFTKENRNKWFSQTWEDVKGIKQKTVHGRRTGAFPMEIPRRLISMFSVLGDTVLDPFLGTGTTAYVALALGRNCIGLEIDPAFIKEAEILCKHPLDESLFKKEIEKEEEKVDWNRFTIKELREMAKERGLKGISKFRKPELIEWIRKSKKEKEKEEIEIEDIKFL